MWYLHAHLLMLPYLVGGYFDFLTSAALIVDCLCMYVFTAGMERVKLWLVVACILWVMCWSGQKANGQGMLSICICKKPSCVKLQGMLVNIVHVESRRTLLVCYYWGEPEQAPHRRVCCKFSIYIYLSYVVP